MMDIWGLYYNMNFFFVGVLQQNCQVARKNYILSYSNGTFGQHSSTISGTQMEVLTYVSYMQGLCKGNPTPPKQLRFSTYFLVPESFGFQHCQLSARIFRFFLFFPNDESTIRSDPRSSDCRDRFPAWGRFGTFVWGA